MEPAATDGALAAITRKATEEEGDNRPLESKTEANPARRALRESCEIELSRVIPPRLRRR